MPLKKLEMLITDRELFCPDIPGNKSINNLIKAYNAYLDIYNKATSTNNNFKEQEASEYLTKVYEGLNSLIKRSPSKIASESIQESDLNKKLYFLIMHSPKIKIFTSITASENNVKNLIDKFERKPVKPKKLEKDIENDAKNRIAIENKKMKQAKENEKTEQTKSKSGLKDKFSGIIGVGNKLLKASSISKPVLTDTSRKDIIDKLYKSNGKMIDTEIIKTAMELPLNAKRVSTVFTNIKETDILNILNEVTEPELPKNPISGVDYFSKVLHELEKHKLQLGGSPVFGSRKPSIDSKDSNRFMFGVPMSAVKDWIGMTIKQKWIPTIFWKNLGKKFGLTTEQMSKYEEAYISIQRFGLLIANKDRFFEILNNEDKQRYIELSQITGLAWHPTQNSASVEKEYIDFIEQFLTIYFDRAQKNGPEAMQEYFQAFTGVCLEDRTRNLLAYAMKYPLEENTTPLPADWDTGSPAEEAFMKEVEVLGIEIKDLPTPDQLFVHLQKKGIFNLEFTENDGTKVKPTKESYDRWAQQMIDYCVLSEPDPQMPGKSTPKT